MWKFFVEEQNELLKIQHLMVFEFVTLFKTDGAFLEIQEGHEDNYYI